MVVALLPLSSMLKVNPAMPLLPTACSVKLVAEPATEHEKSNCWLLVVSAVQAGAAR
jgi:hypothetical protein